MAQKLEVYPMRTKKKKKKRYCWRCLAGNGQPVATGHQSFANKANAKRAGITAAELMAGIWKNTAVGGDWSALVVDIEKEKK